LIHRFLAKYFLSLPLKISKKTFMMSVKIILTFFLIFAFFQSFSMPNPNSFAGKWHGPAAYDKDGVFLFRGKITIEIVQSGNEIGGFCTFEADNNGSVRYPIVGKIDGNNLWFEEQCGNKKAASGILGLKKFTGSFLEKRLSKVNEKLFPGKYEIKGVFSFLEKNLPEIHASVFWGAEEKKPKINPLEVLCIKNLTFDKNEFDIIPNNETENLAVFLAENPAFFVCIEGHTDEDGGEEYNLFLSQKRAASLKKYLVKKGIAPDKISTAGFGEKKPLSKNAQENRRIEISFKKK
jgi:hypothetical protein